MPVQDTFRRPGPLQCRLASPVGSGVARGHWCMSPVVHVSPVVVRVKFLRAVNLDLLLLAMTLY